jgi:hypothetical protein
MSLPEHLRDAAARVEDASRRIDAARNEPTSAASMREWLVALTDYVEALSDVQRFANESLHEKLHLIAGRVGADALL